MEINYIYYILQCWSGLVQTSYISIIQDRFKFRARGPKVHPTAVENEKKSCNKLICGILPNETSIIFYRYHRGTTN